MIATACRVGGARTAGLVVNAIVVIVMSCAYAYALNPDLDVSQYGHTSWKIRDGFFKSRIVVMAQTPDGYLWLGTEQGLVRFDGVRNVPLQLPPGQSLPHALVRSLYVGRDGTLWIGTLGGLASWKNGTLRRYPDVAFNVDALLEDREGTLWAAGSEAGIAARLCAIHNNRIRCYAKEDGLGRVVTSLYQDDSGALWVAAETGLWQWTPGAPKRYALPEPVAGGLQSLTRGDRGMPLVGTRGGVSQVVNESIQRVRLPSDAPMVRYPTLFRDRDGGLWVGTDMGVLHVHHGRADTFTRLDGLSGDFVNRFFEDREGDIWVATLEGLDRFREAAASTISVRQGLSSAASVGAVLASRDGSVWVNNGGVLHRWTNGKIAPYKGLETSSSRVGSLFRDDRDRIWLSTVRGVGRLEGERLIYLKGAPAGVVVSITDDTRGDLWIAYQDRGLVRVSPDGEVHEIPWSTFGQHGPASRILADRARGGIWIGFYGGGLSYFTGGRIGEAYSARDGLADGRIAHLHADRDAALWVAAEAGLSRVESGRIATLSSKNGLPCDPVQWMVEDEVDSVWLRQDCGLVRIARAELDAWIGALKRDGRAQPKVQVTTFQNVDGIASGSYVPSYSPAVGKSIDGKLWFADNAGVIVLDPRHLPFNRLPPPVHVEQMIADRTTFTIPSAGLVPLRLPALTRDLQIDYTGLSLVAPELVQFRYRLEGHDADWQDVGTRRQAFYTDLSPGHYRFRVIASNNSGVWNETGATLNFDVAPAYYQTAWFQVLVAGMFMALVAGLHRLRVEQVARQYNARLEARVGERMRIARDLHDTLLQSFQGLLLKFHALSYKLGPQPEVRQEFEAVIEQARQAITEGRDTVQGLRASTLPGNDLARAIMTFGDELAVANGEHRAELEVHVEGASRDLASLVHDDVYRIACEALRNAYKHAGATRIEVEIQYDQRQLRLRIRDDGRGIDPAVLRGGAREGHYGLPGMHERAAAVGGTLTVWSELDSGTEIELTIPAGVAYAKASAAAAVEAQET